MRNPERPSIGLEGAASAEDGKYSPMSSSIIVILVVVIIR